MDPRRAPLRRRLTYGGGPGMVMKAPVWGEALDEICTDTTLLVVPTPAGRPFKQGVAQRWTVRTASGVRRAAVTKASTSGPSTTLPGGCVSKRSRSATYVLAGGEVATLVMIEAVVRLLPNVMGNPASHQDDSHSPRMPAAGGTELHPAAGVAWSARPRGAAVRGSRPISGLGATSRRCSGRGNGVRICWGSKP